MSVSIFTFSFESSVIPCQFLSELSYRTKNKETEYHETSKIDLFTERNWQGITEDSNENVKIETDKKVGYYKFKEGSKETYWEISEKQQDREVDLGTETAPKGGKVVIESIDTII